MKKSILFTTILIAILFSCKSKKSDPAPTPLIKLPGVDTSAYFRGTVDGIATQFSVSNAATNVCGVSPGASTSINSQKDGPLSSGSYSSGITNFQMKPLIGFDTETYYFPYSTSDSLFKSFFQKPTYQYRNNSHDGVNVSYFVDDEEWKSFSPFGDQAGSTVSMSNATEYISYNGPQLRVTIHISCKVYNSTGSSKTIVGVLMLPFIQN
jgi:hypothetical protein